MGTTDAERQRRYRAHKRGDHSLCNADRCRPAAIAEPVTVTTVTGVTAVTPDPPATSVSGTSAGLGVRGRQLWREATAAGKPAPLERVLLEEACRLADRLDRLDAFLIGDRAQWTHFQASEDGTEVTVIVDKALAEARQQAVALKQIVTELRQATAAGAAPAAGQGQEGSVRDQLAARRAARLADAAGS